MSPTKVYVDAEAAAKAWAKANTAIAAIVAARVFLGVNNEAPFPQLVVTQVGGRPEDGDAPIDNPVISFSCWASSRPAARALADTVVSGAKSMTVGSPMGAAAVGNGAQVVLDPLFVASQPNEQAAPARFRYVTDVQFNIRASAA